MFSYFFGYWAGLNWAWMQRSPDRLAHIDLWLHTTFAIRKSLSRGVDVDEETASAVDFPPAQLQLLRQVVAERLPGWVKETLRSPSYDDFMGPLEDFVVLQRLFRTAFAGGLGHEFPLIRLIELERETSKYVAHQPMIRWEPTSVNSELLQTLHQADPLTGQSYQHWRDDMASRIAARRSVCDQVSK